LSTATGSWHLVFYIAAGMNAVAAVLALALLKPLRLRMVQTDVAAMRTDAASTA
jgi:OFA family oxalate/formate antiporter-like MFS transporter